MGRPSFLDDDDEDVTEAEAVEAEAEPEAPAEPEPEAAEPEAEADVETGEQDAAPPAAMEKPEQLAPVQALIDERLKRQEAEQRLRALETQLQQMQRAQQAQQAKAPDWLEDPEAAAQYQASAIHQQMEDMRLNMSQEMAETQFGGDTVKAALDAFQRQGDPHLHRKILSARHPYGELVRWHRQQSVLSEIGDDPASYRAKIEAEVRERLMAEMQQAQPAKPAAPPPTMGNAPRRGDAEAAPAGSIFHEVFGS